MTNNEPQNEQQQEQIATAKLIAHLLDDSAQHLDMRTANRLAKARQLAVAHHSEKITGINTNGNGQLIFNYVQQHRTLTMAAFTLALAAVLALTLHFGAPQTTDVDAMLLGSDLPPEAYIDKGFNTWLGSKS